MGAPFIENMKLVWCAEAATKRVVTWQISYFNSFRSKTFFYMKVSDD